MLWENLREEEFTQAIEKSGRLCVMPVGCLEMHGQHLPLNTDCLIAEGEIPDTPKGSFPELIEFLAQL